MPTDSEPQKKSACEMLEEYFGIPQNKMPSLDDVRELLVNANQFLDRADSDLEQMIQRADQSDAAALEGFREEIAREKSLLSNLEIALDRLLTGEEPFRKFDKREVLAAFFGHISLSIQPIRYWLAFYKGLQKIRGGPAPAPA